MSKFFNPDSVSSVGKEPSQRQLRVGEIIRGALSQLLLESNFFGTILEGVSITVSVVKISPDLKNATVFVVPLGGQAPDGFVGALNEQANHFRYIIGKQVKLRYTPRLQFRFDDSFDEAKKISALLDGIDR